LGRRHSGLKSGNGKTAYFRSEIAKKTGVIAEIALIRHCESIAGLGKRKGISKSGFDPVKGNFNRKNCLLE
jgi:hypothetical protein